MAGMRAQRLIRMATTVALAASVAVAVVPATTSSAQALTTLTVTTTQDETTKNGTCSLREAVANANADARTHRDCPAGGGRDIILFDLGRARHTIVLDPALGSLVVTDDQRLMIDGGSRVTISGGDGSQILQVENSADLQLTRLRLTHGLGGDAGGFLAGGAIMAHDAHVNIADSTLAHNAGGADGSGGAVYVVGGVLHVVRSTFRENSAEVGGALDITRVDALIVNSTFVDNTAGNNGGAISTFQDPDSTTTRVSFSTFTGNSSIFGGAIAGDARLLADVFADNPSERDGSCAGSPVPPVVDLGYVVSDDATCATAATSLASTDPQLDPSGLAANGGPTRTVALQDGSPAIDLVPLDQARCQGPVSEDQRGYPRPVDGDADHAVACDAGAFEVGSRSGGGCTIVGTQGDDVLLGTPGPDVICALQGDDRVSGRGGADTIIGSSGSDRISGGRGADRLFGNQGNDVLRGGPGRDVLRGGAGHDVLHP
jgi:CSLREA domain-containing protein